MIDQELDRDLDAYLEGNWDGMVADLDRLVRIESVEDRSQAGEGTPYGPGPARALEEALSLWASYGFDSHNCEGYIGYADLPGESPAQIGIIGHMDVVPVGEGWNFPPFEVTRRNGYLLGRGVSDDKGPMVMALHAARFWMERNERFPYTLRFIIGSNEETGMRDLEYYQERFADPDLLFSPDDEFPVCYGEKGIFQGVLESGDIEDGIILEWEGGMAVNAVPGSMRARIRARAEDLPCPPASISLSDCGDGTLALRAEGVQAHASTPEEGRSAIAILVDYLLECGICKGRELEWLLLTRDICSSCDGSGLGIDHVDEDFGGLTLVGGHASKDGKRFSQSIDIRFVTGDTPEGLTQAIERCARTHECGASFTAFHVMDSFMIDKDGDLVQTLLSSYRDVTGDMQEPFTIGGGTYSRHFKAGVGFGVDVHGSVRPDWVGSMHAADEGISEESLKQAFKVYALAIKRLMALDIPGRRA